MRNQKTVPSTDYHITLQEKLKKIDKIIVLYRKTHDSFYLQELCTIRHDAYYQMTDGNLAFGDYVLIVNRAWVKSQLDDQPPLEKIRVVDYISELRKLQWNRVLFNSK